MKYDYISHHGVLGQQWGILNGPPYPLKNAVAMGQRIVKTIKKGAQAVSNKMKDIKNKRLEKIKNSNDPRVIMNNINKFSSSELRDAQQRMIAYETIKRQVPQKKDSFIKRVVDGYASGMASRISNKLVDSSMGFLSPEKKTYSFKTNNPKEEMEKYLKNYYKHSDKESQDMLRAYNTYSMLKDKVKTPSSTSTSTPKTTTTKTKEKIVYTDFPDTSKFNSALKQLREKGYI